MAKRYRLKFPILAALLITCGLTLITLSAPGPAGAAGEKPMSASKIDGSRKPARPPLDAAAVHTETATFALG